MATDHQQVALPLIFRFPYEIRLVIYDHAFPKNTGTVMRLHHVSTDRLRNKTGVPPRWRKKAYFLHNFAITCRQAYHEVRHRYFRHTAFVAYSFRVLGYFLADVRPENLALIQDLEVSDFRKSPIPDGFTNLGGEFWGWHRHTSRTVLPEPRYMRQLQVFSGLKSLRLFNRQPHHDFLRTSRKLPYIHLLKGLVRESRYLEHLRRIEVYSNGTNPPNFDYYSRCYPVDFDDIPGWVHSRRSEDESDAGWPTICIYDILERIHGPHPGEIPEPVRGK